MDQVITFPGDGRDYVITDQPMRLRWGPWHTGRVLLVHVRSAALYEEYREQCLEGGQDPSGQMPPHFALEGGTQDTALGFLRHRDDTEAQELVCYLACLLEALLNAPSDILRTDLIRRVYQEVGQLSDRLGFRWRGGEGRFIPPTNQDAADPRQFERMVAPVSNLQEFFALLKDYAVKRYTSLAREYVFYYPGRLRALMG
ncbi:MAG: hypothetical protein KQH53_07520 [Desulfarculaceae bacterium]|nr:hypothetical protein [Desulfarculaceae bacterium]